MPIFECPSVPYGHLINPILEPAIYGAGWSPATTDYMAVNRSNNRPAIWTAMGINYPGDRETKGAMCSNEFTHPAHIIDGLSNTIMVGEKQVPRDQWGQYPWDCSIYDGHNPVCNTRAGGPDYPLVSDPTSQAWGFGRIGFALTAPPNVADGASTTTAACD